LTRSEKTQKAKRDSMGAHSIASLHVNEVATRLTGRNITDHQGLAGFNPFAGMEGMNNLNDPNAVSSGFFSLHLTQREGVRADD
jgi:hypothetical protein